MDFSIIIPFYNVESTIGDCLHALQRLSFAGGDFEIILVDNNSSDKSRAIAGDFENIQIIEEPKQGSYAARNAGIARANGRILAFTDPDCLPESNWLQEIQRAFNDERLQIVLGERSFPPASVGLALIAAYEQSKASYVFSSDVPDIYYGYTNNMAVRADVFQSAGLFQERERGADTLLVRRVVDLMGCDAVAFNPRMRVTHLEIEHLADYYSKAVIYGRSNTLSAAVSRFRALSAAERWQIYRRCVRENELRAESALVLLVLLGLGGASYEIGRLAARLSDRG